MGQYTYTQDLYTRVMPSQGCFNMSTRSTGANGLAQDSQTPPLREICTTPAFGMLTPRPCTNGIDDIRFAVVCGQTLAGSLCVAFGFNSNPGTPVSAGCDTLTLGLGGPNVAVAAGGAAPASDQRGVLGLPLQQAAANTDAANQLFGYLLR
jgi:hypothetical protein